MVAKEKTRPILPTIEILRHIDGRIWVRVNGRIKLEDQVTIRKENPLAQHLNGNLLHDKEQPVMIVLNTESLTNLIYKKIKQTKETTGKLIESAKVIVFDHPCFVRPYQNPV
jgi:hypothetical protein